MSNNQHYPMWAREHAYVVDRPWADADYVILGSPDPHEGRLLAVCSEVDEEADIEEGDDWPYDSKDAAREISRRWNDAAELREFLFIWGEAKLDVEEAVCTEQDTGACRGMGNSHYDWCDGCKRSASAWDTLQGIERVMLEKACDMRELGYER